MNITYRLDQRSLKKFLARLDRTNKAVMSEADRGLNMEGEFIMTDAKEQTPVEWGTLKSSGVVIRKELLHYRLEFGGAASAYAVYVHETPPSKARHTTGNWKFLEFAMKAGLRGMAGRLAKRVGRAMN